MLKPILTTTAFLALVAAAQPALAQAPATGLSLAFRDGLVTLRAEQVTVRQILAEWERLGQVKVSGAERLSGAPVTLTLVDIPEKQALAIVMRGIPGYMAVDRATVPTVASVSRFDRVVVMARAATPVSAPAAAGRPQPTAAQPIATGGGAGYSQPAFGGAAMPAMPDEDGPDRADVEQFSNAEPPMPEAPVASPYPSAYPGSPYIGAQQGTGPYGGNATAAAAAGVTGAAPPETQFDYANPQKYFEERRQQQLQQQGPTATPSLGTPPGMTPGGRTPAPVGTPTAPGTLARPGIAPVPTGTPPAQGEFFNPYNLPPDWVPPPPVPDSGTPPVEPDRAKYANPYEQPKPPHE